MYTFEVKDTQYDLSTFGAHGCREILETARQSETFSNVSLIIIGHILPTTLEFCELLKQSKAKIELLIEKPFSGSAVVRESFQKKNYELLQPTYDEINDSNSWIYQKILEKIRLIREKGRKVIFIDIGGCLAEFLVSLPLDLSHTVLGVIEDTTSGHNRYLNLCPKIGVPIYSVARSPIKEFEAPYVAQDALTSLDISLRKIGFSIPAKKIGVVGFGMIGKQVAHCFHQRNCEIYINDVSYLKMLEARMLGYKVGDFAYLLNNVDVLISVTGKAAVGYEDLCKAKDRLIVASMGTRNIEFDIAGLNAKCAHVPITDLIDEYTLENGKKLLVLKRGEAINFSLPSLANEVLDFVFSEMASAALQMIVDPSYFSKNIVNEKDVKIIENVSSQILRCSNGG